MKTLYLTYLAGEINQAIDANTVKISLEEMRELMIKEKALDYLERHRGELDISLLNKEAREYLNRNLKALALVFIGRERRKCGVENNGLCLLLGYLQELIQRGCGQEPAWDISVYEPE